MRAIPVLTKEGYNAMANDLRERQPRAQADLTDQELDDIIGLDAQVDRSIESAVAELRRRRLADATATCAKCSKKLSTGPTPSSFWPCEHCAGAARV